MEDYCCPVCGVLIDEASTCYNCGFTPDSDEPGDYEMDWRHPLDKPYEEKDDKCL